MVFVSEEKVYRTMVSIIPHEKFEEISLVLKETEKGLFIAEYDIRSEKYRYRGDWIPTFLDYMSFTSDDFLINTVVAHYYRTKD